MNEEILAMAKLLSSCREDEAEALELLCEAAWVQLCWQLKNGLSPEECRAQFVPAAAWLAAAKLLLTRSGESGEESFTAGDVSVRHQAAGEIRALAAAMEEQALRQMQGLLQDRGFAFGSVKV